MNSFFELEIDGDEDLYLKDGSFLGVEKFYFKKYNQIKLVDFLNSFKNNFAINQYNEGAYKYFLWTLDNAVSFIKANKEFPGEFSFGGNQVISLKEIEIPKKFEDE